MKLILSSCDFRNDVSRKTILQHLPKPVADCRLLFIPNEKATTEAIRSGKYHRRMSEFGFCENHVVVFDYRHAEACMGMDIDVLYVSGGNTFVTLDRIRSSGFDTEFIRYIRSGVTYIGGSAGAHIVTQDVSHVAEFDECPKGMTDLRGLGLFDGILVCHYTDERREHYERLVNEGKFKVYALTDNDFIVIDE